MRLPYNFLRQPPSRCNCGCRRLPHCPRPRQADGGLAAKAGQGLGEKENSVGDAGFQYQDADAYFGFGFDGWQSGIHEFPAFKDESSNAISENGFIKRGFPMGKLETLLSTTLHQLEGAVTIERE